MAIIEGFGDEVIHFFIAVVVLTITALAWRSTQIADLSFFRTIVILERQHPRQPTPSPTIPSAPPPDEEEKSEDVPSATVDSHANSAMNVGVGREECVQEVLEEHNTTLTSSPSTLNVEECGEAGDGASADAGSSAQPNPPTIKIRLKYLNDDSKLVEGTLEEQVGDFKRRHFSLELSARKLVRLIFKGQDLKEDSFTLGHYGLHNDCVVHCLVHNANTSQRPPRSAQQRASVPAPVSWFARNGFLLSCSLLLCLVWYSRFQYAYWFTTTSTMALVGLTAIFTVSVMAIYRQDADETLS